MIDSTLTRPQAAGYRLGFTSLDSEVRLDALPVEGVLPRWLTGTLLRNGPARFSVGTDAYRHWFDGLAMVHRFTVGGGAVSYANRFLRTPAFCDAERTGRIAQPEFATNPHRSLIERVDAMFGGTGASHNANVNIVPFADGYLALTETPSPVAFDGETLETRGVLTYDDQLTGQITTAHTHHDPERRATFNILIELARKSSYSVVRIADGSLRRTVIASIAIDEPAYLHAFSTTARYVVIAEYPLVVRPLDLLLQRKPFIDNYHWKPQRGTRFHVIDKDTGARAGSYEPMPSLLFITSTRSTTAMRSWSISAPTTTPRSLAISCSTACAPGRVRASRARPSAGIGSFRDRARPSSRRLPAPAPIYRASHPRTPPEPTATLMASTAPPAGPNCFGS
jgi:beta,beta-carotene 9',10'-dioxygenase